jgi:hypothetical protein
MSVVIQPFDEILQSKKEKKEMISKIRFFIGSRNENIITYSDQESK